jgi:hypothetical protein
MFQKNLSPPSSGWKESADYYFLPDDGGDNNIVIETRTT